MNISQRLRTCAKHTGLDAVIELLNEAADEIDRLSGGQQADAKTDEPDDVVKDAERYRWLRSRMCGADFDWNESGIYGLVFELPDDAKVSANCDKTIDAAMTAAAQAQKGQP